MVAIITVNSIVFMKQPSAERYLANLFFTSNFVDFQKILAARQKNVSKNFGKLTKKTPVAKSYVSKVECFYRNSHLRSSVKMVFLERCSQNSQENTCVRDSISIKGCKKETPAQLFSCEFYEISKNSFFTEHLQTTASAFSLSLQFYLNGALPTVF